MQTYRKCVTYYQPYASFNTFCEFTAKHGDNRSFVCKSNYYAFSIGAVSPKQPKQDKKQRRAAITPNHELLVARAVNGKTRRFIICQKLFQIEQSSIYAGIDSVKEDIVLICKQTNRRAALTKSQKYKCVKVLLTQKKKLNVEFSMKFGAKLKEIASWTNRREDTFRVLDFVVNKRTQRRRRAVGVCTLSRALPMVYKLCKIENE